MICEWVLVIQPNKIGFGAALVRERDMGMGRERETHLAILYNT